MMVCPQCKADRVHRSHRAGLMEWAASRLDYYPYRCQDCGERRLFRHDATEAAGVVGKEVVRTRRRVEWVRTRREILLYATFLFAFAILLYFITRQCIGSGGGFYPALHAAKSFLSSAHPFCVAAQAREGVVVLFDAGH
jgi:hypothetical protein